MLSYTSLPLHLAPLSLETRQLTSGLAPSTARPAQNRTIRLLEMAGDRHLPVPTAKKCQILRLPHHGPEAIPPAVRRVPAMAHPMREARTRSGVPDQAAPTRASLIRGTTRAEVPPNLLAMGILPASKWRFLKHLSLADNSLTAIPASSLGPLSNTLHSLDLSSNLFTQIPDSLANLTALRALNLSHCMIDSLHSLTRNPLPAITALNLRANRLQSMAGIEKLYPLERLDLRDNRLTDPLELARLTGIPEIREIWVEGNPFVRTHRNYRITIFNLFRKTPGYTEDVTIDASGPTYTEKRYLIERVPVPAAVPVVKPPVPPMPAVDVVKPAIIYDSPREPALLRKERPMPAATASEVNTTSTRRRRAPKRRIVDLATNDPHARSDLSQPPVIHSDVSAALADDHYRISYPPETNQASPGALADSPLPNLHAPEIPRIDTSVIPQFPPVYASHESQGAWKESQDWDVGGEMYRRKIEALRDQVGNGYLSVLSEEGWDPGRHPPHYHETNFSSQTSPIHTNPATPRAAGVQAVPSGRTLG